MTDPTDIKQQLYSVVMEQKKACDECEALFEEAQTLLLQATLKSALATSLGAEAHQLVKKLEA